MDRKLLNLYKMKNLYAKLISEYKDKCPHNKGVDIPKFIHGMRVGARLTACKRCGKTIGIYCKCSPDHNCYYDTQDGEASDYHDTCIFCGLLFED